MIFHDCFYSRLNVKNWPFGITEQTLEQGVLSESEQTTFAS